MLQDFQEHINHTFPFLKGKKILLAISGGIDSVVLAHLLHQSKYEIVLAHCNFKLRGNESDLDQVFVNDLANQLKLPFLLFLFLRMHMHNLTNFLFKLLLENYVMNGLKKFVKKINWII